MKNSPLYISRTETTVSSIKIIYFNQFCVKSIAIKVAHKIQFDRSLKIGGKKLHMLLHTKHGDYNP